jgi:uncharacterized protein YyaL (SSP411 family)
LDTSDFEDEDQKLDDMRRKLYEYRLGRTNLQKDDKILTSWSALMRRGHGARGRILREPRYFEAGKWPSYS